MTRGAWAARALAAAGGLGCSSSTPGPRAPSAATDALARRYLAVVEGSSPETATALGHHEADHLLDDRSPSAEAARLTRERALLADVVARQPRAESLLDATDLSILRAELEVDLARTAWERPLARRPDLYASPMNAVFTMLARDYAPLPRRAADAVARMNAVPAVVAQAKANLSPAEIPPEWVTVSIEMARSARAFFAAEAPALSAALPGREAEVGAAVERATSAYDDYATFLERDVAPRARGSFAIGRAAFDHLARTSYHLDQSPEELRAVGARVLEQTKAELGRVAARIDPSATGFLPVIAAVKKRHPTAAELLPTYRREVARVRAFLAERRVVPFPEGDDCEVIETPVFLRSTLTAAYDQAPPFDPVTKGLFFVTPVDPRANPAAQAAALSEHDYGDVVDTAVHEVYPGHHLQLSFARRHPSLTRKITGPSIFAEGWALYSEELLAELGYYTDEERLMQLSWTLVRAARVILDVDLHTRGMTAREAVAMLMTEAGLGEGLAKSEVARYVMTPTQPLSYLIGREQILAMREKMRARDGAAFSLLRFHDELLRRGTVAPALLARELGL
ncbi:MAG: DUF885 domain-containing protein [Polyangiaceae bacterium]|nr:DUF885 domain-containing protein [Polyangiaceae bacterium]